MQLHATGLLVVSSFFFTCNREQSYLSLFLTANRSITFTQFTFHSKSWLTTWTNLIRSWATISIYIYRTNKYGSILITVLSFDAVVAFAVCMLLLRCCVVANTGRWSVRFCRIWLVVVGLLFVNRYHLCIQLAGTTAINLAGSFFVWLLLLLCGSMEIYGQGRWKFGCADLRSKVGENNIRAKMVTFNINCCC